MLRWKRLAWVSSGDEASGHIGPCEGDAGRCAIRLELDQQLMLAKGELKAIPARIDILRENDKLSDGSV